VTQTAAAIVSLHEPQRQSLMAIVFMALRIVGQIGIVQLAIGIGFMLARAPSIAWLFVVALLVGCVLLGIAGLTWWRYTFCVVNSELQVRSGVLSQQTLSVPLDRIQSVLLEQKVLHRPFDLVQVSVRTAGSDTAEFTIDALHRPVADALQRAAADHRRTSAAVVTVSDSSGQAVDPPPLRSRRCHSPGLRSLHLCWRLPMTSRMLFRWAFPPSMSRPSECGSSG